jgi:hypothetical protein
LQPVIGFHIVSARGLEYVTGNGTTGWRSDLPVPKPPEDVEELLRRTGAGGTPAQMGRTLGTESVLVFCGEWHESLRIYGQDGSEIGAAVRFNDRRSVVGYSAHYELRDSELMCIVRDMTAGGFRRHRHTFAVVTADDVELGTIMRSQSARTSYEIAVDGRPAATIQPDKRVPASVRRSPASRRSPTSTTLIGKAQALFDRMSARVWAMETAAGDRLARITYLPAGRIPGGREVAYALELDEHADKADRTMAMAFCLGADARITDVRGGGG